MPFQILIHLARRRRQTLLIWRQTLVQQLLDPFQPLLQQGHFLRRLLAQRAQDILPQHLVIPAQQPRNFLQRKPQRLQLPDTLYPQHILRPIEPVPIFLPLRLQQPQLLIMAQRLRRHIKKRRHIANVYLRRPIITHFSTLLPHLQTCPLANLPTHYKASPWSKVKRRPNWDTRPTRRQKTHPQLVTTAS